MSLQNQIKSKFGPPTRIKPQPYSIMLEMLENQSNRILTNEYYTEIVQTLSNLESLTSINPSMIDLQPEIQWFMRPFLLDFLLELHSSFKLQPQTLFLCMNIIDRYCSKRIVFKRHYQLVGCTALWIAGKYEDKKSRVPTLKELTIMCRNAYDEEMFVQMEMHILSTLEWTISHPTLEDCLQLSIRTLNVTNSNITPCKYNNNQANNSTSTLSAITAVGRFLCELSLYDKFFLSVPTSLTAITSNLLACSMLQIPTASINFKELITSHFNNKHNHKNKIKKTNLEEAIDLDYETDETNEDYFYEDTNDTTFDENIENKQPEIVGAFLSGLDDSSLNNIKKIALMLIIQLSKVTEVLSKKYEILGVIQVINNFHSRNTNLIQTIYEQQDSIINDSFSDLLIQSSEILLNFPSLEDEPEFESDEESSSYLNTPRSPYPFSTSSLSLNTNSFTSVPPVTPPSATSQYSVFSNKRSGESVDSSCNTPTYVAISSFAPPQPPPGSELRTKSKIRKNSGKNRGIDQFSPIKSTSTNSSLTTSSPLMNHNY
ncbi:unnamed protein product [Candida verbasci]|uniref:G1/S-specific cyclin n=1 Tax=Candida verbasci TaxID=1227364 RepID=A0A9W4U1X7_9ASCO|nr:unnamed protein product [Candida verbasci]